MARASELLCPEEESWLRSVSNCLANASASEEAFVCSAPLAINLLRVSLLIPVNFWMASDRSPLNCPVYPFRALASWSPIPDMAKFSLASAPLAPALAALWLPSIRFIKRAISVSAAPWVMLRFACKSAICEPEACEAPLTLSRTFMRSAISPARS